MNAQLGEVVAARKDGAHVFRLSGEFDLSNAWRIQEALMLAIRTGSEDILVDLGAVRFMDAQLLRSLIRCRGEAERRGLSFAVIPPRDPDVWRVAQLVDFPLAA